METITQEEYRRRLSVFVADQKAALTKNIPSGFFGNWAFYVKCQKSFDELLARDGIEVIQAVAVKTPQTGKIPG
ncbi:hypothetical protein [Kaistia terrae]|uniref:Uncharacterized protein n=1 Tax=Kaistia terrae TaxID=537017 RepID=A0ABW0PZ14_9HYPH|nr:hypothetical protein [Kaistia terrae]MCX5580972.1 hypothetical protein [Kaistia terrae]